MRGWTKFALTLSSIGFFVVLIMMLAGFMRLTVMNKKYTQTECVVVTTEIREETGICVAGKCSPSKYSGEVEFRITSGQEIWVTVITSYTKSKVEQFMTNHFKIMQETKCYIDKWGSDLRFQLHDTTAILVISILIFILSGVIFSMFMCCCVSEIKKKRDYVDLDKEQREVIDSELFGNNNM